MPDISIDEVKMEDYACFIIPGGEMEKYPKATKLFTLLQDFHQQGKIIGAICEGPFALARAGILKDKEYTTTANVDDFEDFNSSGYIDQGIVRDRNIITAKGCAFIEFGAEIAESLGMFQTVEYKKGYIKWLKNI